MNKAGGRPPSLTGHLQPEAGQVAIVKFKDACCVPHSDAMQSRPRPATASRALSCSGRDLRDEAHSRAGHSQGACVPGVMCDVLHQVHLEHMVWQERSGGAQQAVQVDDCLSKQRPVCWDVQPQVGTDFCGGQSGSLARWRRTGSEHQRQQLPGSMAALRGTMATKPLSFLQPPQMRLRSAASARCSAMQTRQACGFSRVLSFALQVVEASSYTFKLHTNWDTLRSWTSGAVNKQQLLATPMVNGRRKAANMRCCTRVAGLYFSRLLQPHVSQRCLLSPPI